MTFKAENKLEKFHDFPGTENVLVKFHDFQS